MKKSLFVLFVALMAAVVVLPAQGKFSSKTGTVKFEAQSAMSDAKAENHQVRAILDPASKEIAVSLLISSFEFEKALMQQHFNSDMESDKLPKSTFSGKITSPANLTSIGAEPSKLTANGELTVHGITKKLENVTGTIHMKEGKIVLHSEFSIIVTDYKVSPRSGVEKTVKIVFDAVLNPA